jgi:hypothetical protein
MSKLRFHISMSLTRMFKEMFGETGGKSGLDNDRAEA